MRKLPSVVTIAILAMLAANAPARATAVYEYKPGEYVTVDRGKAPDGKHAIAAHGEGELGADNFHLWLMTEPGHRKVMALPGIDSDSILDSAAKAFSARWAPDSHHVTILHRADRHVVVMDLYAIRDGRVQSMSGPSLLEVVTKGQQKILENERGVSQWSEIVWTSPTTFTIEEHQRYHTSADHAGLLGAFGRQNADTDKDDKPTGQFWLEFSAVVTGVLVGDSYQLRDLKPGTFEDDK